MPAMPAMPARPLGTALAALLCLGVLVGCTSRVEEPPAKPSRSTDLSSAATQAAEDRKDAVRIMRERAAALRAGDEKAFLADIDPKAARFLALQKRYFANLTELPLSHISMKVGDQDKMMQISAEGDYQLPVDFTMQLEGYDARPVTIPLERTGDDDQWEVCGLSRTDLGG